MGSTLETSCPKCGRRVKLQLNSVRDGATVTCSAGHRITLEVSSRDSHSLRTLAKAERDLERSLRDLKRRLR